MLAVDLVRLLEFLFVAWLGALAAVVAIKMLRGEINTHGLLSRTQGSDLEPERVALLVTTLAIAGFYVIHTLGTPLEDLTKTADGYFLPDLPEELLVVLGGSQATYLTAKFFRNKNGSES